MLRNLSATECPICKNNTITSESVETMNQEIRVHTNGGRWESRTFACGQKVSYVPNYSKDELSTNSVCKNNPELQAKAIREKEFIESLIEFVENKETVQDQAFFDRIKYELSNKLNFYRNY